MAYTIKAGDTLTGIANKYGTTVAELARINNIANPNLIIAGNTLQLPSDIASSSGSSGSTPSATAPTATAKPAAPAAAPAAAPTKVAPVATAVDVRNAPKPLTKVEKQDALNAEKAERKAAYTTPYTPSEAVIKAQQMLDQQLNSKPGDYNSTWQAQLDDIYNRIQNRDKFEYDLNGDALYQQYKNQYVNNGRMAMMDTIGQASALTGGYGNSYAQSVGQQTYQNYLNELNNKIPELYQLALDQYNREGEDLYNQYALVNSREAQDYARYQDAYNNWLAERDFYNTNYNNERSFDYGVWGDQRNFNYQLGRDDITDAQWQQQYDYQLGRDAVADRQWQAAYDYQLGRDTAADAQWQAEFDEAKRQFDLQYALSQAKAGSSGGSGSSGSSSGSKSTGSSSGSSGSTLGAKVAPQNDAASLQAAFLAADADIQSQTGNGTSEYMLSNKTGDSRYGTPSTTFTASEWNSLVASLTRYGTYSGQEQAINDAWAEGKITKAEAEKLKNACKSGTLMSLRK